MEGDADLAAVAALIGDQTRACFLVELLGGRGLRASALAACAGVSRATASFHLAKLLAAGIIEVEVQGRHRVYRLADPRVAEAIEALLRIAPRQEVRSLRSANAGEALGYARFCYDHLAGGLAIEILDAMTDGGLITLSEDRFELSERGGAWFDALGVEVAALRTKRRSFARSCLDWSERRPHLAGALGAGLAERLLELSWIRRAPAGRAVRLTLAGRTGLSEALAVELASPQTP